jgi:hypothetical protein
MERPESSAKEVRLALVNRMLAELVLAASEGAAAKFFFREKAGEPFAVHDLMSRRREMGPDPEGVEGARDLAKDILKLLSTEDKASGDLDLFLASLAASRPVQGGIGLVSRRDLEELEEAEPSPEWRQEILELMNRRLARRTLAGDRYLYLFAQDGGPLVEELRQRLPQLKIITLAGGKEQFYETEEIVTRLRELFVLRHNYLDEKS